VSLCTCQYLQASWLRLSVLNKGSERGIATEGDYAMSWTVNVTWTGLIQVE